MGPIGAVIPYAGEAPPDNWYFADGSEKSVAANPLLFNVIGYKFGGAGDVFNLPDPRGRVPMGAGDGSGLTSRALGSTGGQEAITEVPTHTHAQRGNTGDITNGDDTNPTGRARYCDEGGNDAWYDGSNVDLTPTGSTGSASVDVVNPFLALNYIIRHS